MAHKKSRFVLQTLMYVSFVSSVNLFCMDELNHAKDVCVKNMTELSAVCVEKAAQFQEACMHEYDRLQLICLENTVKAAMYYEDSMKSIDADNIFLGCGVVSSAIGAYSGYSASKKIVNNDAMAGATAVTGVMLSASLVCGLYNLRAHHAMVQDIENKYGLTLSYDWYQLPGYYATQCICYGSDVEAKKILPCIQVVKSKVESMHDYVIFDFEKFIHNFPHTDFDHNYCIAKKYFAGFGCATLSDLQNTVQSSCVMLEQDFKKLLALTNMNKAYKMPLTFQDFHNFSLVLHQGQSSMIANSLLGAFGYSALHHSQQVKHCLVQIVKYHAYLIHLQEILSTCSDALDTKIDESGNLKCTLQHTHHAIEIK